MCPVPDVVEERPEFLVGHIVTAWR